MLRKDQYNRIVRHPQLGSGLRLFETHTVLTPGRRTIHTSQTTAQQAATGHDA